MASQQSGVGGKQARNQSKKGQNHKIIYRHQDCIPDSTKLDSIAYRDRQTVIASKSNQVLECHHKVACDQVDNKVRNKTKQQTSSTKTAGGAVKLKESLQVNTDQCNETVKNNDELTKSRKRRLRKQKLLVSLAPSQPLQKKPNPTLDKAPSAKPVSHVIRHPVSTPSAHQSTPRVSSSADNAKSFSKDQRKRPDKIVGTRNKSIKTKTLIEQSKADIIKTLEEKALSSLLQTLVPLTNTSPKKDQPPPPVFSFHDKWTNRAINSKVDGVFYFGETKRQLEKLATNLKDDSPSNTPSKIDTAQNNTLSIVPGTQHNPVSPLKFSSLESNRLDSFPISKQPWIESVKAPQYFPSKVVTNNSNNNLQISGTEHFFSTQRDLPQFPVRESNQSIHSVNGSPLSELHSSSVSCKSNLFRTSVCANKIADTQDLSISELTSHVDSNFDKANLLIQVKQNQNMKPSIVENTNETREEVLLKREAKKAAKLAAKVKHKTPKDSQEDGKKVNPVPDSENNKVLNIEKETSSPGSGDTKSSKLSQSSESTIMIVNTRSEINVKDTQTDKSALNNDSQEKSNKSGLKAERRAKQEAQRAAKAMGKNPPSQDKRKGANLSQEKQEHTKSESMNQSSDKKQDTVKVYVQPRPKLFIHLYQEKSHILSNQKLQTGDLHPAVVRLGIQYSTRVIAGSNARCVALLHALKQMVNDYTTPSEKEFSRGLEEELGPMTAYLHRCRPLAVSMTNALRHIKRTLTQLPNSIKDVEARRKICDVIDTYIHEQIDVAGKAICNTVREKIANGDVILTYGCSSLVYKILVDSHNSGTKFRVVVVDGMPWKEGKEMLRRLVRKGISCTYVLITAASFIMREANKVLLGAHALLANGYVMSRAGSSQVALLARCYNVPVLVCCETHKFCERVQTDAFVYNELGDLRCDNDKSKNRVLPNLTPLSLAYDVTPPDLVSAVVTELAVLPCTSVPVILRIKPSESVM